ncbi:hypothetical protein [Nostoc sp. CMAA1605]|nr:hypothetical protein [Nostoc sp. CMAA1605]
MTVRDFQIKNSFNTRINCVNAVFCQIFWRQKKKRSLHGEAIA